MDPILRALAQQSPEDTGIFSQIVTRTAPWLTNPDTDAKRKPTGQSVGSINPSNLPIAAEKGQIRIEQSADSLQFPMDPHSPTKDVDSSHNPTLPEPINMDGEPIKSQQSVRPKTMEPISGRGVSWNKPPTQTLSEEHFHLHLDSTLAHSSIEAGDYR